MKKDGLEQIITEHNCCSYYNGDCNECIDSLVSQIRLWISQNLPQEKGTCETPLCQPEQLVSHDMAIDAGDPELEGSVFTESTYERCGGCPSCIHDQILAQVKERLL